MKKIVSIIADIFVFILLLLFFVPLMLLYFLFKLIMTPFDYAKYRSSLYQRDFPHKYSWLREPHVDNILYTAVKESNLPIEYIKPKGEYDLPGYFIYKDILLNFSCPFFYDSEKGLWICLASDIDNKNLSGSAEDDEKTDNYLTVVEASEIILNTFSANASGRECKRVIFFYDKKRLENECEEGAWDAISLRDDFVIYDKDSFAEELAEFIKRESECSDNVFCPYLGEDISGGLCYDMRMIANNAIKPEALPDIVIDKEKLLSLCECCVGGNI